MSIKLAEVLITLTRTVDEARVRARVNRPHMMALKRRLRAKKSYAVSVLAIVELRDSRSMRTPRMLNSTSLLSALRLRACDMELDHDVVSSVVVLFMVS